MRPEMTAVDRLPAALFTDAAPAAGIAPVLNAQPWLWQVHPERVDLSPRAAANCRPETPQGR
jgi:hypothetical protein